MRLTKKQNYRNYGIEFNGKKLIAPNGLELNELLKLGNTKIGKVWQFSTLPTALVINTKSYGAVRGTCPYTCEHCYGTCGNYCFPSVRDSLARNAIVARECLNWTFNALKAQLAWITKDNTKTVNVRIHVTGDFFNLDYATMWKILAIQFPCVSFWTYTKSQYGDMFDDVPNLNVVKSVIDGIGFNFGTIAYILDTYRAQTVQKFVHQGIFVGIRIEGRPTPSVRIKGAKGATRAIKGRMGQFLIVFPICCHT